MTPPVREDLASVQSRWLLPGVRLRTAVGLTVLVLVMLALSIVSTAQPLLTLSPLPARIVFLVVAVAGLPFCLAAWRLRRIEIEVGPAGVRMGHIFGSRLTSWDDITGATTKEGVFGVRVVLLGGDEQLDDTVLDRVFEARADDVVRTINDEVTARSGAAGAVRSGGPAAGAAGA
ncbi:hypothetical protein GC722_12995 [Auraticoccus sp. F435]|uniref:PH domain-containing protein n=1 Tax=Auraticoccus cholistanensis TaxID=2656650 RepID=A0A6A9UVR1_9ACTN|nr:PH domain-containing protein [Auraticoccus cholistanensis]MVA76933.1 hypothetical protein [Auraticoccus cholistanensis]